MLQRLACGDCRIADFCEPLERARPVSFKVALLEEETAWPDASDRPSVTNHFEETAPAVVFVLPCV